jgi:hypothetical protein
MVAAPAAGTGGLDGDVTQFPAHAPSAPQQNTVRDDPPAHPCPERHEDQVIDVFAHAEAELAPSRRVGVVLDSDWQPRAAA